MKSAHQILIDYGVLSMGEPIIAFQVQKLIEQAQKEAYNQALDDAVKSAYATIEYDPNGYCGNTGSEYPPDEIAIVNKNSILKLRKE